MQTNRIRLYLIRTVAPFLTGLSSAAVVVFAFLLPSIQDQYDRYQSRKVINQYESLGDDFFKEEHYTNAEAAYAKAYELSESKRLDIEVKRMNATVNRINENEDWGKAPPEDMDEIDYQYLLHLQKSDEEKQNRFYTLNSYGRFLAGKRKFSEAQNAFDEAIKLNPDEAYTYIHLGNLYDQQNKKAEAEKMYLKAISLNPDDARAHYNLGLLYADQQKTKQAEREFYKCLQLDSTDQDAQEQYKEVKEKISK
ncbi:MAG: tetratricopeptide repeat protein [Bacteroidetes bacterium]|nr:tetratricopeptide repeat protein [Bacteroidota bacterium]